MSGTIWPTCIDNLASREWEIDCRLKELIGKLVSRTISRDEETELHMLQRERVNRMMPKSLRQS